MTQSSHLTITSDDLLDVGGEATWSDHDAERARLFSDYWQQSQHLVRAYLASFLPDNSILDDCVQEVALVAWKKGPLSDGHQALLQYSYVCARYIGMAARRKIHGSRLQLLSPEVAQSLADAVAMIEPTEEPTDQVEALRHCIDRLSKSQQDLLQLRYGDDSANELSKEAERTGKKLFTLYKRLERLRVLLRDCVIRQLFPSA